MAQNDSNAANLSQSISALWRTLIDNLFDPYRPELHYMRGPGPKWHAKHAPSLVPVQSHTLDRMAGRHA